MDSLQGQPPVSSESQDPDSKQSALCAAIGLKPHSRLLLIALCAQRCNGREQSGGTFIFLLLLRLLLMQWVAVQLITPRAVNTGDTSRAEETDY